MTDRLATAIENSAVAIGSRTVIKGCTIRPKCSGDGVFVAGEFAIIEDCTIIDYAFLPWGLMRLCGCLLIVSATLAGVTSLALWIARL